MEDFKDHLVKVESTMSKTGEEYPEMDPDARRECRERVGSAVKTLLKIQADLDEADRADPDARVVRVVGYSFLTRANAQDFECSFNQARILDFQPTGIELKVENNFMLDGIGKVIPSAVEECYITFRRAAEAKRALTLGKFDLHYDGIVRQVKFAQPSQTIAMRATFREIGEKVVRMKQIEAELDRMGAMYDGGQYIPNPSKYVDDGWYTASMPMLKRARAAGVALNNQNYHMLKDRRPVKTADFMARTRKLQDEESDILIALRDFQLSGLDFDF